MAVEDRWRRLNEIWQSALRLKSSRRAAFLRQRCSSDEGLRLEIESLLGQDEKAGDFLEPPDRPRTVDLTSRALSHYDLVEKIGEGGMGVVYKARDTHLDRFVALKLLPPEKVADPERKRRFVQEAKAASALNHPNIVTIHDIDAADGITFIAMEYVNGQTLDRLIRSGRMPVDQSLRHGAQIASALAAAHAAGIIHRDIQPANIMVTETGVVKVLDFGLAKLAGESDPRTVASEPSLNLQTAMGQILGTIAYMSPEQAEGGPVDPRSDIFSLGLVLYEMTTGRRAFSGESGAAALEAILTREPEPVALLAPETPQELESVIGRCLQKDPARRFQSSDDVKAAIEDIKNSLGLPQTAVGIESTKPRFSVGLRIAALFAVLAIGAGVVIERARRPAEALAPSVRVFAGMPGTQTEPALSPDGRQMAFIWKGEKQDNLDIYVQADGDPSARRLTNNFADDFSPVWSPDAKEIAFLRSTPSGTEIITVPSAGGVERKLHVSSAVCRVHSPKQYCGISWSPRGEWLAIVDRESPQSPNSIFLLNRENRERRRLTQPPSRPYQDGLSAFSPDGSRLAFARCAGPLCDIYVVPISDSGELQGQPRQLTRDNDFIFGFDWTPDGRSIVFSSSRAGVWGLWRAPLSRGDPERLRVGGSSAFFPSLSKTGNRLAYSEGTVDHNIWRIASPLARGQDAKSKSPTRITAFPFLDGQPSYSPDGAKIAWTSIQSGTHQVWIGNADGSESRELTKFGPPGAASYSWSPDGRKIAFLGFSAGPTQVHVVNTDGTQLKQLTNGDLIRGPTLAPAWSRDSRWVYFVSNVGGEIWKVSVDGGSPIALASPGSWPLESHDGASVYFVRRGGIWKVPAAGGTPAPVIRGGFAPLYESYDGKYLFYSGAGGVIQRLRLSGGNVETVVRISPRARWTLGRSGIYALDPDAKGGPTLEFLPMESGSRERVQLPGDPESYVKGTGGLAVSPDERWLMYPRLDKSEAQVMLVENFR
jgi:eukaryotic-like serine/threonine-protein kinase